MSKSPLMNCSVSGESESQSRNNTPEEAGVRQSQGSCFPAFVLQTSRDAVPKMSWADEPLEWDHMELAQLGWDNMADASLADDEWIPPGEMVVQQSQGDLDSVVSAGSSCSSHFALSLPCGSPSLAPQRACGTTSAAQVVESHGRKIAWAVDSLDWDDEVTDSTADESPKPAERGAPEHAEHAAPEPVSAGYGCATTPLSSSLPLRKELRSMLGNAPTSPSADLPSGVAESVFPDPRVAGDNCKRTPLRVTPSAMSYVVKPWNILDVSAVQGTEIVRALYDQIPLDQCGSVSSIGSLHHNVGRCHPCLLWFQSRCPKGINCTYCHLPHLGQKKKRIRFSKKMRQYIDGQNDSYFTPGGVTYQSTDLSHEGRYNSYGRQGGVTYQSTDLSHEGQYNSYGRQGGVTYQSTDLSHEGQYNSYGRQGGVIYHQTDTSHVDVQYNSCGRPGHFFGDRLMPNPLGGLN